MQRVRRSLVATRRRIDSGRFTLPGKFGLSLKGNIQNYVPVTDEMLRNPPDGDWLMFRRNYAGWSYSPLNQINTSNVSQLQLKWMWSMPENGTMEITPMVHNGIIYIWGTGNTIQALDAKTGNLLWENRIGPGAAYSRPRPLHRRNPRAGPLGQLSLRQHALRHALRRWTRAPARKSGRTISWTTSRASAGPPAA